MLSVPGLKRIAVPLDGSPLAEATLPWVEMLALRSGAVVDLITCVPGGSEAAEESLDGEERASRERVGVALRAVGIRVERSVVAGDPANAIAVHARSSSAQLITMATHGRSGIARAILGSVTDKLLRLTTVPVLVVRQEGALEGHVPGIPDTILAPLDGSGVGSDALPWVAALARLLDARVVMLHAIGVDGQPEVSRASLTLQAVSGYMEKSLEDIAALGLKVEVRYSGLGAKQAIAGESTAASLIVMASVGATATGGSRRGSVADHVIRNGTSPVVVVPPLGFIGPAID